MNLVTQILTYAGIAWEAVSRTLKTKKDLSIVGNILRGALFVSNLFNKGVDKNKQ